MFCYKRNNEVTHSYFKNSLLISTVTVRSSSKLVFDAVIMFAILKINVNKMYHNMKNSEKQKAI